MGVNIVNDTEIPLELSITLDGHTNEFILPPGSTGAYGFSTREVKIVFTWNGPSFNIFITWP